MEDLKAIRRALNEALRRIRGVAARLPLPDIEPLSVVEALSTAARRHERLTGTAVRLETHGLPMQLPFPLKACLYRFVLESLGMYAASGARHSGISVSSGSGRIVVHTFAAAARQECRASADCRSLPQAREPARPHGGGGRERGIQIDACGAALIAELNLANMEPASG